MKTERPEWSIFHLWAPCTFYGMYHIGDYLRLLLHRGPRTIFWCGSDIKAFRYRLPKAHHVCENEVEALTLLEKGISAEIRPLFFRAVVSFAYIADGFISSKRPRVYLSIHPNREQEYGMGLVYAIAEKVDVDFHIYGADGVDYKNIFYHGIVSEEQFDREIQGYQAALRLNKFDGFSEILGKSALLGQYPISAIEYPHMSYAPDPQTLIKLLNDLKYKKKHNPARMYWVRKLSAPLV